MTETQGEVRVRNVSVRRSESLLETATEFGGNLVRIGISIASLPVAIMPRQVRVHMQNATRELLHAFAILPGEFAKVAGEEIEKWAAEAEATDVPAAPVAK